MDGKIKENTMGLETKKSHNVRIKLISIRIKMRERVDIFMFSFFIIYSGSFYDTNVWN